MKLPVFPRKCRESFGAKVFAVFALLTIGISFTFTSVYFLRQKETLTESMVHEGKLLAQLLAHNSRMGVFAENAAMLGDPMVGILENTGVDAVAVFSADGGQLLEKRRTKSEVASNREEKNIHVPLEILSTLRNAQGPVYMGNGAGFEFWAPVALKIRPSEVDTVFFGEPGQTEKDRVIGFVKVVIAKEGLVRELRALLLKSVLLAAIFLVAGSIAAYFLARGITNPLKKLTERVKALGGGTSPEKIPVETFDEIGRLADAFNTMTENLLRKEGEKDGLEEQLRHSQKMEAIGTLAGGVAHDFNNILTVVTGYGSLLRDELPTGSPLRGYADQVMAASDRAAVLTRRILAFSRKQLTDVHPVNINELITSLVSILSRLIREDINLKFHLTDADTTIMGDSGHIDQMIINLCTNARDAMPDGGALTIETTVVELNEGFSLDSAPCKPGKYVLITVADNGVGMDENIRERVFDPFFTTKEVGKGTGLGLSMVYGIVRHHDGFIMLESAPGKGSRFKIYLPATEPSPRIESAAYAVLPYGGNETILLVEDDIEVRGLVRDILNKNGYRVIEALDTDDAIGRFREDPQSISMLLLDVIMPKRNGKELLDELNRIKPNNKALFISGYTYDVITRKGIIDEELNFIAKPVKPEELLRKVHDVLRIKANAA